MDQQAEEARWIAQTLDGKTEAFNRLVERYTGAVYNQAYRMLNNAQEAEDAVQEAFIRAYTRLSSFDPQRRFSAWLLTISSNYCIDRLRRKRYPWLTLDDVAFWLTSDHPGPERSALDHERQDEVQQMLNQLPDNYRTVTVLRYWHDMSYQEIANATGLTESAVKTRLHRARRMLLDMLKTDGTNVWDIEATK